MKRPEKKLVLESGQEFVGTLFGADKTRVCEIVFNTSVVGYQEIVSDPTYAGQFVVMTYPLIGNYGITDEDYETRQQGLAGLIVRECCDTPSNFRYTMTIEEELEERGVPCISGVDTRMITRIIRDHGRMRAAIVDADVTVEEALKLIKDTPDDEPLVKQASCKKRWRSRTPDHKYDVVVIDCGIKNNIIRILNRLGCDLTVLPYTATAHDVMAYNPDGVIFSSGPGSPFGVTEVLETIKDIKGQVPVLGIGMGHELIGMSYGLQPEELHCGIHGDRPVRNLETGKIGIAVLNQSVGFKSVEGSPLTATYITVPGDLIVGFRNEADKIMSVQFHAEAAPGPRDLSNIFDSFIEMMEEN